jgi:NifU-like protein involved in Fe-S cluster formation
MELNDLYSERILEIAARLRDPGRLRDPQATARRLARTCGSVIEVDLVVVGGVVTGYGAKVSACALGQTSASVMQERAIGSNTDELRQVHRQMHAMLEADGAPPKGRWAELRYLEPVRDFRARHGSTLLVFDAVVDCLDQIERQPGTE